jgi:cysteine-rich repeat protein
MWSGRRRALHGAVLLGALLVGAPALAAMDATGRWLVVWDHIFVETVVEDMVQTPGGSLSGGAGFTGTIDSASGAFFQTRPGPIPAPGVPCPDDYRSGTFAGDGETFAAMGVIHRLETPTACFVGVGTYFAGSRCGSGLVRAPESCDDGNLVDGDGCSGTCGIEPCFVCTGEPSACSPLPPATACDDGDPCSAASSCDATAACVATTPVDCDDGVPCTEDLCSPSFDGTYVCLHGTAYRDDCRVAGASSLILADDDADDRDRLMWRWTKGASTTLAEFADPRATATYELCLYAPDTSLLAGALVPPNAVTWAMTGEMGFRYRDHTAAEDGTRSVRLKSSTTNRTSIRWKGKGAALPDLHPPLDLPLIVQLRNTATNVCWGASYTTAKVNRAGKLKVKTPAP